MTHDFTADHLPSTLKLWFCIGCNSLGHFAGCAGECRMEPMEVVSAATFADLLALSYVVREQAETLAGVLARMRIPLAAADDPERVWRDLKVDARKALAALRVSAAHSHSGPPDSDAYFSIERCSKCGAVEATRPCIGVCIRKVGEFVPREPYDALAAEVERLARHCDGATTLISRVCSTTVRNGHWAANLAHFEVAARRLPAVDR